MSHDHLWAPWRLSYVKSDDDTPKIEGCFLCHYSGRPEDDSANYVIERGQKMYTVLNRYPYNNGHLLIAPYAHKATLAELDQDELLESVQLLQKWTVRMSELMNAEGFNVGLNLGSAAGAGVPGHLHWHIVPRWAGDTNFMPVVGDVKVIPQALDALYQLLTSN